MEPLSKEELGRRIRALRDAAGLTAEQLGESTGLSPTAISRIETGIRSVKSTELANIAAALDVSVLALLDPSSLAGRLQMAARTNSGAELDRRDAVVTRLRGLVELSSLLPPLDVTETPQCLPAPTSHGWQQITSDHAVWARSELGLEPAGKYRFSDIVSLIETRFRVDVVVEDFLGSLVGASISDPNCPLIFVNADQPLQRARFTLAHELYHFLSGDGQSVVFDADLSGPSSERDANAFAASFLMPREGIESIIESHGRGANSLGEMIATFGVSYQSLVYRLHNAGFVRAGGRDDLLDLRFTGLLGSIDDATLVHHLQELRTASPGRRAPTYLTARALKAFHDRRISIQPLADLMNEDPEELLEQLRPSGTVVAAAFDEFYGDDVDVDDVEMSTYFSSTTASSNA